MDDRVTQVRTIETGVDAAVCSMSLTPDNTFLIIGESTLI